MTRLATSAALACLALAACSANEPTAPSPEPDFSEAAAYTESRAGDALIVWQDGEVLHEVYQNGYDRSAPHVLFSGTKTLAGLAALAAVEDGLLAMDTPLSEHVEEWRDGTAREAITLRQLLHLTSGLSTDTGLGLSFAEAVQQPLAHEPGEGFRYGETAFQAFGFALEAALGASGSSEDAQAYLERRILQPLGVRPQWWRAASGDIRLGSGALMTAREWLRVGQMLLAEGEWNGERVLRAETLRLLTAPTEASPGYGFTVWLNAVTSRADFLQNVPPSLGAQANVRLIAPAAPPDLYAAAGAQGQRLYLVPSRSLIVVRMGRRAPAWSDAVFLDLLFEALEAS